MLSKELHCILLPFNKPLSLCGLVLYLVEGVQCPRSAGHQPSLSQLCPIRAGSAASVRGVFDLMMPAEVKAALAFLHLELIVHGCFGIPVLRYHFV